MPADKMYVRIVRDDESITYKGPLSPRQAEREANVWREAFPRYQVDVLGVNTETRRMVRLWTAHIKHKQTRYYGPRDWRDEMYETARR